MTPARRRSLVLHYGGYPCDVDARARLAEEHGLVVLEDAAHAPGATWHGEPCGTFGRVGCFSFFSNKNLPVGEGGMIVTDDDDLAERLRLLRSHGMTTLTWERHRGHADELRRRRPRIQLPSRRAAGRDRSRTSSGACQRRTRGAMSSRSATGSASTA